MRTLLSWSTGKDSAWSLNVLRQRRDVEVIGLVTTVNSAFGRVAMHGVRRVLAEAQAEAAGLPLYWLEIPHPCPNDAYERIMGAFVEQQAAAGVAAMAFGDLFLEDIRRYRETRLAGTGIAPLFPLWGTETGKLAREMIAGGLEAYVTCVDPRKLPARLVGRRFDAALLAELPPGVDPCAENGEFHTFACAGPMFRSPIAVDVGSIVRRDGFVFCDLVPARGPPKNTAIQPSEVPQVGGELAPRRGGHADRVVSLIASATEIACALGCHHRLVGRSHECDYPPEVLQLPALTAPKFKVEGASADIHERVSAIVRNGLSVYRVDGEALKGLEPDVILTQDHCEVCAVSLADVEAATCAWTGRPAEIVSLRPGSLADVYRDIARVARALDVAEAGERVLAAMQARLAAVRTTVAGRSRPRVAFIEWVDPLMAGGNWMPELIDMAGGHDLFGEAGAHSDWMAWDALLAADPEVIVVAPCGYGLARCLEELPVLEARPGWSDIAAVKQKRVYFADGNAYFNRPGPRLADSAELLAELLHPEVADRKYEGTAWLQRASFSSRAPAGLGLD
ncbi:MAG TPA: ABC transporter substrate-binding protein [Hyphomicrobiaceae bacterium]|nr:ABC transporter substrate-binding protein [Hyphomicrobiaceae bacterium]